MWEQPSFNQPTTVPMARPNTEGWSDIRYGQICDVFGSIFVRIRNYLVSLDGEGASNELGKSARDAFSFISIACVSLGGRFWGAFPRFSSPNNKVVIYHVKYPVS